MRPLFKATLFILSWAAMLLPILFCLLSEVRADTYGLPPYMEFEKEWRIDVSPFEGPQIVVARSKEEWSSIWKNQSSEEMPEIDFERLMVVGIRTQAGRQKREIYRVELNDSSDPKEMIVRVAHESAYCQVPKKKTFVGTNLHLIAIGRSALPVKFVEDTMVDGRHFLRNGGIEELEIGVVQGIPIAVGNAKAATREKAEQLVYASMTPAEIKARKSKVWPGLFGNRYPQLWSVIEIGRNKKAWSISYDGIRFQVDVESGRVERIGVQ